MFGRKLLIACAFLCCSIMLMGQINHVEPLNWWVGMKNTALQVMINGNSVGNLRPSIEYPGVKLKKSTRGNSPNYLFLDLDIAPTTKPGTVKIKLWQGQKLSYSYDYPLLQRQKNPSNYKGFDASDVIYLITPDRFSNGDPSNDVVAGLRENRIDRKNQGGRHGGDLRGIINHLDYIADMGFTAIWPTPVLENDMPDYSYHGYAITDHYKVDPRMGNLEDYKELSIKAREKGIKLIYDGVINHIGLKYWWMDDLPFKDWINYADSLRITSHRRTTNQDPYAAQADKDLMTKGWFVPGMPDMNGENPFVANYLIQNTIWWIETLQLGGLRQDTYPYSQKDFSKKWSCAVLEQYPNFSLVGEEWSYNPMIASYWQQGKKNKDGYTSCLNYSMDFPLQLAIYNALTDKEGTKSEKGLTKLYEGLANDFGYANPNKIMVFLDNHDMDRIFTQYKKDLALTKMALAYLFTTRGVPQIYYGTEILADNSPFPNDHGYIRSDFPGGWDGDQVNAFKGIGLSPDQAEMQTFVKKLLQYRKNNLAINQGKVLHYAPVDDVYVYFRYHKDQIVMVVLNKNEKDYNLDTGRFREIIGKKTTAKNVMDDQQHNLTQPITVSKKSATVFEIK